MMFCLLENGHAARGRPTLIGTPANIVSSMAGSPSFEPGILMNRFGRAARAKRSPAFPDRACRLMSQNGRDFERYPSTVSPETSSPLWVIRFRALRSYTKKTCQFFIAKLQFNVSEA